MKNIFKCFLFLIAALTISSVHAQEEATVRPYYFDFGLGGHFPMNYDDLDPRFLLQLEGGGKYIAVPVTLSFGQDIIMAGIKFKGQYWIQPVPELPKLLVSPGFGPLFNYWNYDKSGVTVNVYEFGLQFSGQVRYQVLPSFHFSFMPIALDMNFWRHGDLSVSGLGSASDSNSDFKMVYSIVFGAGIDF